MKWIVLIPVVLLEIAAAHGQVSAPKLRQATKAKPPEPAVAKLRWKNLETLSGELRDASPTELSWQSPLFEQPLQLRWDAIRGIDKASPGAKAPEPFGFVLRDGSHLLGELIGINNEAVTIKSTRHLEVTLKRSEVLRIYRSRGGNILAAGPSGDVGWELDESNEQGSARRVPRLITGAGGALVLPYWNTKVKLPARMPDRGEIGIDLRFEKAPAFALRFAGNASNGLRLETWGDELVLAHGEEFQPVRTIGKDERSLALRICWDRTAKKCALFSASGEPLAQWQFTTEPASGSDLSLHSKGRSLTVTRFYVREWDGQPPAKSDLTKPRVQRTDGTVILGSVIEASPETLTLTGATAEAASTHPIADIAEIVLSNDGPKSAAEPPTLAFADGTLCHGSLISISGEKALIETKFASAPLAVSTSGLRQIRMSKDGPAGPDATQDEILIDSTKLRGTLTAGDDGRLHWLPVGGVSSAAPRPAGSLKVTRTLPPDVVPPAAPALFYTAFGDIIPGTFRGQNDSDVELESELVEAKTLPATSLNAVQFGDVMQLRVHGFDAPGWKIVKGDKQTVSASKDALEISPGGAFAHPLAMQSDEIRFSFNPAGCGGFRLRLFSSGAPAERTTNFVIAPNGDAVFAALEELDGESQGFNNIQVGGGKPIAVRVQIKDASVSLYVGDRLAAQAAIDPKKRAGSGLVIEPSDSFFGSESTVKLTDFATSQAPGRTRLPSINAEARAQALTIPRFRKERPPQHALIATNGDIIRGQIEATTATHFSFLAGLEKLRIPRARVNTAIWLKPPSKDAPAPSKNLATEDLLNRALSRGNMSYGGASLSTLLSVLTQDLPALKFNHKVTNDGPGVSMAFSRQTARDALEEICRLFGLRYRVEEDGSITLESGPEQAPKYAARNYLLRSGAFPDASAAQARLVEKGIEFPKGTSAKWNPADRQLVVTHTAEMQGRIEELLKQDFGDGYTPLTHWVLLINGGRVGLTVERFEKDFIRGHHPEYGRCQVPMPLVFSLQTSKPAPSDSMRSLASWHLIPAVEPVIPGGGGESSPTLGKEAATFKLPLLAGGDFDLKADRGKVVVLDFWATWCAPCIKSIPDLIEAIGAFPKEQVKLIGVNQGESAEAVKRFIETRQWQFTVAMDADQKVAQQYGVSGIPHTVIVGPDGKVAWVKTGFSPEGAAEAAQAIKTLLSAAPATATEASGK